MKTEGQGRKTTWLLVPVLAALAISLTPVRIVAGKGNIFLYLPAIIGSHADSPDGSPQPVSGKYTLIAWNDLGLHCMDPGYGDFAVLPPYNTLWAQLIRRDKEPDIVTEGVTVSYRVLDNTRSDNKTDFWDYAQQLFDLPNPLPPNIGLRGFGLQGVMAAKKDHFAAEGIPLTEYLDSDPATPQPYQVAEVVATDSQGRVLATTRTVLPVSTEMHCEYCHQDNGPANPGIATGVVKRNILTLHDKEEGTDLMARRPVLCAGCHSSNALSTTGRPDLPSLSRAMHRAHARIDDGTMEGTCYACHPGPRTRCLRGVMFRKGMQCQDCHGSMDDVASPDREPWIDEPRCGSCHGAAFAENTGRLYRFSRGHGGIYCQACHGSQHAIAPSSEPRDNIQAIRLQGHAGTIDTCTVCHTNSPDRGEGPHRGEDD